jgi:tRNA threonylcarbamoyl adenosine modification protein YeaZ
MTGTTGTQPPDRRRRDGRRHALIVLDTALSQVVVATGTAAGDLDGLTTFAAGHRHGETLLPTIGRVLGEANVRRSRLAGVVVGLGPGAFTGLRVGLATAKGLALGLGIPIVGISTAEALLVSAAARGSAPLERLVLLLPAGPNDRIVVHHATPPELLPAGTDPAVKPDETLLAVDLDGRAPAEACALGEGARAGLGAALLSLGAARLAANDADDVARLVPAYVTLPRGIARETGEVEWSRDPR